MIRGGFTWILMMKKNASLFLCVNDSCVNNSCVSHIDNHNQNKKIDLFAWFFTPTGLCFHQKHSKIAFLNASTKFWKKNNFVHV